MSDRFAKRRVLLLTQSTMMLQAFVLAALVWSGQVQYWHVAVLATIYGLGRAVDIPARQSFVTDLVGKPDLPNAVALNSIVFNRRPHRGARRWPACSSPASAWPWRSS